MVAADGRKGHLETHRVVDDNVQKVFSIQQPGRELAYALSGTVVITAKDNEETLYDFVVETAKAVKELSARKLRSLWHYAEALSDLLLPLPDEALAALDTFDENLQATIIFLIGYYDGRPKCAHIKIFYDGQVPEISTDELHRGHPLGVGSEKILEALINRDSFAKYRKPALRVEYNDRTLADAIEVADSWMSAHCDPEAVEIDSKCSEIGGHVHICTITPKDGFRWIVAPRS